MNKVVIHQGDVLQMLKKLSDNSIHCCVTSPPYWGLRDYGVPGQLGLEKTPEEYIENMVAVFREVRRVLRADGTLWLNMGDSYMANCSNQNPQTKKHNGAGFCGPNRQPHQSLKPKDLCMIPARLALALQADGWWLRSEITWCKTSPMPESVTDRPTSATEKIFMLTKSPRYFYDAEAVKEKSTGQNGSAADFQRETKDHLIPNQSAIQHRIDRKPTADNGTHNLWNYWVLGPAPFKDAHFATFVPELVRRCVAAGTSQEGCCPKCGAPWRRVVEKQTQEPAYRKGNRPETLHAYHGESDTRTLGMVQKATTLGWRPTCGCCTVENEARPCIVLDPFSGSGTTGLVAAKMGRNAVLIELNQEYVTMAIKRIKGELGMLAEALNA